MRIATRASQFLTPPFVFLLSVSNTASIAIAQSVGTFAPTGSMITARSWHTATLLPDGRVLIAGGFTTAFGPPFVTAKAEIYNPATGVFSPTGDMIAARGGHKAILLPDGRVLIGGGTRTEGGPHSPEIYDPATGTFASTGSVTAGQFRRLATLLNNGKVLILVGHSPAGPGQAPAQTAELYDPATGNFSAAKNGNAIGGYFAYGEPTLLADGKVLLEGGANWAGNFLWGQLYDPASDTFTQIGTPPPLGSSLEGGTATLLLNGNVFLAGGGEVDIGATSRSIGLYDPNTESFTQAGNMAAGRYYHGATLLSDGRVLISGGDGGCPPQGGFCGIIHASTELYDPSTNSFRPAGNMTETRTLHTATLLVDGRVLVAGGFAQRGAPTRFLDTAEIYDPPLRAAAPMLFSISGDGQWQGAILHAGTARFASGNDPAVVGEALEIYCTGLSEGTVVPPQVAVSGRLAEVLYFGSAPGLVGVNQVNVRVPAGITLGPAVPVRLTHLGRTSNAVTIGVQ